MRGTGKFGSKPRRERGFLIRAHHTHPGHILPIESIELLLAFLELRIDQKLVVVSLLLDVVAIGHDSSQIWGGPLLAQFQQLKLK